VFPALRASFLSLLRPLGARLFPPLSWHDATEHQDAVDSTFHAHMLPAAWAATHNRLLAPVEAELLRLRPAALHSQLSSLRAALLPSGERLRCSRQSLSEDANCHPHQRRAQQLRQQWHDLPCATVRSGTSGLSCVQRAGGPAAATTAGILRALAQRGIALPAPRCRVGSASNTASLSEFAAAPDAATWSAVHHQNLLWLIAAQTQARKHHVA
jgi:hypothetical protein